MALEDALKAHASSLDLNTKALEEHTKALNRHTNTMLDSRKGAPDSGTTAPKADAKPAETPAPKKEEKPKVTREMVVKALKDHAALEGKEASIAILTDLGADSISTLDPDKYAEAIAKTEGK